jgi:hypothetical protein
MEFLMLIFLRTLTCMFLVLELTPIIPAPYGQENQEQTSCGSWSIPEPYVESSSDDMESLSVAPAIPMI